MSRPKQRQIISDFSGGMVRFPSPLDLRDNQFQNFNGISNVKIGRVEKVKGHKNVTAAIGGTNTVQKGQGFHVYRTEYNAGGTNTSTVWYVVYRQNSTSDMTFERYDKSGGTGGSWVEIFDESTWAGTAAKTIDMFDHNQILRFSDGNFTGNTANTSQWYGYIKRKIFGNGITHSSSGRFQIPGTNSSIGGWFNFDCTITPPTIISMAKAFDRDEGVEAANKVGIHITHPDTTDALLTDLESETFKNGDKYTCTFLYDYVQESALGKSSDEIGVRALTSVQNDGKRIPGIQLVVSDVSFNKRITGINLYWNPEGDVDWYLVAHLDILDGWSDDPKALEVSSKFQAGATGQNMGYWLPVPDWTSARTEMTLTGGTAGRWDDSTGSWSTKNFAANDIVIASVASGSDQIGQFDSLVAEIGAINTGGGNTQATLSHNAIDYTDAEDSTPATKYVNGGPLDTTKAATWYIPNDGFKGYTYQAFTGRHAGQRVPAIRWQSSAVINDRVFYGNCDTEDENEQTVRERSRVYYTPVFKPDEINPANYKDFGRNDGDVITSLEELDGRLYVLKENNVYVYNTHSGSELNWYVERHYRGVGCSNNQFSTRTKYGVACANGKQISLITPEKVIELSLPNRATWQGQTIDSGSMSYSPVNNTLVILPDIDNLDYWIYNFDLRSWSREAQTGISGDNTNFRIGPNQEVVYVNDGADLVKEMNDSATDNTSNIDIKTKQFDFGAPDVKKRFGRIYVTYKTDDSAADALTLTAFLDGSGSIAKTITFAAKNALTNVGDFLNLVGKTLELRFRTTGEDFILDDVVVEYTIMGHTP